MKKDEEEATIHEERKPRAKAVRLNRETAPRTENGVRNTS